MAEFDNNNTDQNGSNDNSVINTNINNSDTNNRNTNSNNNVNNNQSPYNKVPEYSFQAEQLPYGSDSNYNPHMNSRENNNLNRNDSYGNQHSPYQGGNYQNNNQSNSYQYNSTQNNSYQNNSNNYNSNHYSSSQSNINQNNSNQSNSNQNFNYQNNSNPYNSYPNNSYPNSNYPNNNYQYNSYLNNEYQNSQNKKRKERKPVNKAVKFMAKAICFGLIAAVSFFGIQELYYVINPNAVSNVMLSSLADNADDSSYEVGYTKTGMVKTEDKSAISNVADNTLPSIVSINCASTQITQWYGQTYDQQVEGSGSGIIVGKDEKELLIATNNHVVEGADKIAVTFADGTEAEAIVKGTDSAADLAVVTVDITKLAEDTLKAITVAKLGNSDEVKVGEMAIAIGNALGYGQSVTVGYISAKDRKVEVSDGYNSKTMVLLQTDAAINPGNSGGALINIKGEVIGINTIKYAASEVEGMGYAIPISKATPIINDLMIREVLTEAQKGYLGIAGDDVTEDVASFYNMPIGVFIKEISKGGAAEKAGLLAEDIITGADDIEISSISQLREYVNSLRVGTEVKITYMRNTNGTYEKGTVTAVLGQNPNLTD